MANNALLRDIQLDMERADLASASNKCLQVLRADPANVPVMEHYGEIALQRRRNEDAMLIFQKLLAVAPRNIHAHQRLAALYNDQGDVYHATGHARAALEIDHRLVEPHIILGVIAITEGRKGDGAEEFAQAHKWSSDRLEVDLAQAQALNTVGRFDEAAILLRELIALYPDAIAPYSALASIGRIIAGHEDEALLRSLLTGDGTLRQPFVDSPHDAALAHMALFKLESDAGNHSAAFTYLECAKENYRRDTEFDVAANKKQCLALHEVFSGQFVRTHQDVGWNSDEVIFVVGMPRSGSTLLERILASEENVAPGDELSTVDRLLQEVCARYGKNQHDTACLQHLPKPVWAELGKEYIRRARAQVPDGRYFVDKNLGNIFRIGFIKTMLPRAPIIHCVRHPVATCLSIFEQNFASSHPYSNDLAWLGEMYLCYREALQYWQAVYPDSIFDVAYEDIVSDAEKASAELFDRLGLKGQRDMQKSQSSGLIRTASQWQARQAVHTGSVERWKHYREQLRPLLDKLAPILDMDDLSWIRNTE